MHNRADINQKYYYTIHHVNDSLPAHAQPFMANKKPTQFAEVVYENIYSRHSDEFDIFEEIENGNIYFSIYDTLAGAIPDNALPLIDFSASEKIRIHKESRSIAYSINTKKILNGIKELIWTLKDNPPSIATICFYMLIAAVAGSKQFENLGLQNNAKTNTNENSLNNEITIQESSVELFENNAFTLETMPDITWKKITNTNENYPRLNNHEKREGFIHQAIAMDDLARFMYAIEEGYDITKKNAQGKYTFAQAARHNAANIIHYVVTTLKIDLNHFQPVDMQISESMMLMAIEKKHDNLSRLLVKWGYDPDYIIDTKQDARLLHMLATHPGTSHIKKIKKLIELGANINAETKDGYKPVFIATIGNNVHIAEVFLNNKCNTEMTIDKQTYNLLSFAITRCPPNIIEFLLKHGFKAEINFPEKIILANKRQTIAHPIQVAISRQDLQILKLLFKYDSNKLTPQSAFMLVTTSLTTNSVNAAYFLLKRADANPASIYHSYKDEIKKIVNNDEVTNDFFDTYRKWIFIKENNLFDNDEARKFAREKLNLEIEDLEIPQEVSLFEEFRRSRQYFFQRVLTDITEKYPSTRYPLEILIGFLAAILTAKLSKRIYNFTYNSLTYIFGTNSRIITSAEQIEEMKKIILAEKKAKLPPHISIKNEDVKITPPKKIIETDIIDEAIKLCTKEKDLLIDEDSCLKLFNKSNSYLSNYKQIEVIESYRSKRLEYNEKIKNLHNLARYIKEELIKQAPYIGNKGKILLNSLKDQLEKLDSAEVIQVNLIKTQITQIHDAQVILKLHDKDSKDLIEWICDTKESIDLKLTGQDEKEVINKKTLNIRKKLEEKNAGCDKDVGWAKRSSAQPNIQDSGFTKASFTSSSLGCAEERLAQPTLTPVKQLRKREEKTTDSISTNSNNHFFKTDHKSRIMNDDRVIYVNQLKLLIENLINDEKNENRHKLYNKDAKLYLLMKTSHLIAQIAHKYNSVVILPSAQHLYFLRNNIIHYPELCFENADMRAFNDKFYQLFNLALGNLATNGNCSNIEIKELHELCPFIMNEHREDTAINITNNCVEFCLNGINELCNQTKLYYELARDLNRNEKYEHEGLLHSAMHALILRFREKLKTLKQLDEKLFHRINNLLPSDLIKLGNHIAHNTIDIDMIDESIDQRKSYAREDIHYKTLLDLTKNINEKIDSILFIINDYLSENNIDSLKGFSNK